jgi:hypothetical protein
MLEEQFEDTIVVIRILNSKNRQDNGYMKSDNDL